MRGVGADLRYHRFRSTRYTHLFTEITFLRPISADPGQGSPSCACVTTTPIAPPQEVDSNVLRRQICGADVLGSAPFRARPDVGGARRGTRFSDARGTGGPRAAQLQGVNEDAISHRPCTTTSLPPRSVVISSWMWPTPACSTCSLCDVLLGRFSTPAPEGHDSWRTERQYKLGLHCGWSRNRRRPHVGPFQGAHKFR